MMVLVGVWLLVVGYGLFYVGYNGFGGHPVKFQDAFFGAIGAGAKA